MSIQVLCPGCKKRFQVSEKFAGKQGPCPQCKTVIKIPEKAEEVVIHAPEEFSGAGKDAKGRPVLKPITRTDMRVTPVQIVAIAGGVVVVLIAAIVLGATFRGAVPTVLLAFGAIVLAPPIALGGYTFMRDDEFEPYRGTSLWLRTAACAAAYALLWGVFAFLKPMWGIDFNENFWQYFFAVPPLIAIGALAAYAAYDLDFTNAALHYCVYLGTTVILRVIMQMPPM